MNCRTVDIIQLFIRLFKTVAVAAAVFCGLARARALPKEGCVRTPGQALGHMAARLGGVWIKIAQICSSRHDLFSSSDIRLLGAFRDAADSHPLEIVLEHCRAMWLQSTFDIEPRAVAAGAIAQVHAAVHRVTGAQVVIKFKKPRVEADMVLDICLLRTALCVCGMLPRMRTLPVLVVADDLVTKVRNQFDFERERETQEKFRNWQGFSDRVGVPLVLEEYSTDSIIVMTAETDLLAFDGAGAAAGNVTPAAKRALLVALEAVFEMVFFFRHIHGDIHAGNLYYRTDGSIVLLDFGLTAETTEGSVAAFLDFFMAIALGKGTVAAEIVLTSAAFVPRDLDRKAFEKQICELIAGTTGQVAQDFSVARFVSDLFEIQRRHGVRGSADFMWSIYALFSIEGIVRVALPWLDFQGCAVDYIVRRRLGPVPARSKSSGLRI